MAQTVRYYEDNVEFEEGPFVVCHMSDDRYRIEVELKNHKCPVLPDPSVCRWLDQNGLVWNTHRRTFVERYCDNLNEMVRQGQIVLEDNSWVKATLGS